MPPQISKEIFVQAMAELGHDPKAYSGKKISLSDVAELYDMSIEILHEAIARNHLTAYYASKDQIFVDAIDAAHLYYCIQTEAPLYSQCD